MILKKCDRCGGSGSAPYYRGGFGHGGSEEIFNTCGKCLGEGEVAAFCSECEKELATFEYLDDAFCSVECFKYFYDVGEDHLADYIVVELEDHDSPEKSAMALLGAARELERLAGQIKQKEVA